MLWAYWVAAGHSDWGRDHSDCCELQGAPGWEDSRRKCGHAFVCRKQFSSKQFPCVLITLKYQNYCKPNIALSEPESCLCPCFSPVPFLYPLKDKHQRLRWLRKQSLNACFLLPHLCLCLSPSLNLFHKFWLCTAHPAALHLQCR